jgi:hypothetical protein
MGWLSIFGMFSAILSTVTGHILLVLEQERVMFFTNWAKLAVFSSSVLLAAQSGDVMNVAIAAALSTAGFTVGFMFYLPRMLSVSAARILLEMCPMFLAGLVMFLFVKLMHPYEIQSHFVTLIIDASIGAAVFISLLGFSWMAAGRPDGPEKRILGLVSRYLRKPVPRS